MRIALKPIKELGAVQVKLKSIFALKPIFEETEEEIIEQPSANKNVFILYTGWHWDPEYETYYGVIKFNKATWSVENKLHVTNYMIDVYAHCIIRNDRLYIAPVRDMISEGSSDRGLLVINTTTNQVVKWIKFSHVLSDYGIYSGNINDMAMEQDIAYILIEQYLCRIIIENEDISLIDVEGFASSLAVDTDYIWISTFVNIQKRAKSDLSLLNSYTLFSEEHSISRILMDDVYIYGLYVDFEADRQGIFRFNKATQDKITTYIPEGYRYIYYHFTLGNDNQLWVYCSNEGAGKLLIYNKQLELQKTLTIWQYSADSRFFNLESMVEGDNGFWSGSEYNYETNEYMIFRYNNDGEIINEFAGNDWQYCAAINDYDKSKASCMLSGGG